MNRPLASASVASARSAPAMSRPRPANASVPSSIATTNTAGDAPGPARQPSDDGRDGDEQDDLRDLDDQDRRSSWRPAGRRASAASRRAA